MSERTAPLPRWKQTQIGLENERRFFEAHHNHSVAVFPGWLFKIEKATREEDNAGTDAWAHTDRGRIPIQIKSSCRRFENFRKLHPDNPAVIVVVRETDSPQEIQQRTIFFLAESRERQQRNGPGSPTWPTP